MEFIIELEEVAGVEEVDEAVANIALILGVAGKVKEIIGVGEDLIYFLGELFYGVFVGDISYHDGSPRVILDIVNVNGVGGALIELLKSIVLAVAHVVILAPLVVYVVVDWMHIDGASVTLLKGINRPNLIVN
jgi:hypothetical protein